MKIYTNKKSSKGLEVTFLNKMDLKELKSATLKANGFEAKNGQMVITEDCDWETPKLFVGTTGVKTDDDWRILGHKITQKLKTVGAKSASINVPKNCASFVEGLYLGNYSFDRYKSESIETILNLTSYDVLRLIGLSLGPNRLKCAMLSLEALKSGLNSLKK